MKTKQIDQLKRARTELRGWMARKSDSPDISRVEETFNSIITRLQKAKNLQMEIEKLMNDDDQVRSELDAQGPWFDGVRECIHDMKSG